MFEVKRMIEANKKDFKMKVLESKFYEDDSDAIIVLKHWTIKYADQVVVMGYRK